MVLNGKEVATYQASLLKGGMAFGELSILHNTKRSATIKSVKAGVVYTIGREHFLKYLTPPDIKREIERRGSTSARKMHARRGSVVDNLREKYRGSIVSRPKQVNTQKKNALRSDEIESLFEILGVDRTGLLDIEYSMESTSSQSTTPRHCRNI